MDVSGITPEAVFAQKQALVQAQIQTRVFRQALDAQAAVDLQMVQMMDRAAGLGNALSAQA